MSLDSVSSKRATAYAVRARINGTYVVFTLSLRVHNNHNQQKEVITMKENTTLTVKPLDNDIFAVQPAGEAAPVRHSTTAETTTLFNAVNGSGTPVKDIIGDVIEVSDIVVTSVDVHEDRNDEESPLVSKSCANFFTTDGQHYSSLSNGIIRAVKNLFNCGLAPTPENPVRIKFKNVNTPRGVAHSFDLVK